jgi:hypothetical protein
LFPNIDVEAFPKSVKGVNDWIKSRNAQGTRSSVYVTAAYNMNRDVLLYVERLCEDLRRPNLYLEIWDRGSGDFENKIINADKVIVIGSSDLKTSYDERIITRESIGVIGNEIDAVRTRIYERGIEDVLLVCFQGPSSAPCLHQEQFPTALHYMESQSFGINDPEDLVTLLGKIYKTSSVDSLRLESTLKREIKRKFQL